MGREKKIQNAMKRSDVHRKSKREKEQAKLKRRLEVGISVMSRAEKLTRSDQEGRERSRRRGTEEAASCDQRSTYTR